MLFVRILTAICSTLCPFHWEEVFPQESCLLTQSFLQMSIPRWQGRLPLLHRMGSLENLFPAPRFWIDPDPDPWLLLLLRDAHVLPFSPFFSAGLKVNRLDMYGEKYKPFKGIKYMTKAGKFQVRTWRACVPWRSNYGHVFISYLSKSKMSACFLGQFPPGSICSLLSSVFSAV